MLLIKVPLLFCGVAFASAAVVIFALLIVGKFTDGIAVASTFRGWIGLLGIWWAASFLLALGIARMFHVFPPFMPK